MKNRNVAYLVMICLVSLLIHSTPDAKAEWGSSGEIRISPIYMTANTAGLEITPKLIERWVSQTDLNHKQLEELGVKLGIADDALIRKLAELGEDVQSRRFIEYLDASLSFRSERGPAQNLTTDMTSPEPWRTFLTVERFINDAVAVGSFDQAWESDIRSSLEKAAKSGGGVDQLAARARVRAQLMEARQLATRRARGYRQLADTIRRELDNRDLTSNITMVVEIRAASKQPTIAPLSEVTMDCSSNATDKPSKLLFMQRKRQCNENGICKVESVADATKGSEYTAVFQKLRDSGRTYLDGCQLKTVFFVDGTEVAKELPGKFTSHIGITQP